MNTSQNRNGRSRGRVVIDARRSDDNKQVQSNDHSSEDEEGSVIEVQEEIVLPVTRSSTFLSYLPLPASRKKTRRTRYRSRNCDNFKRFGEFFHFLDQNHFRTKCKTRSNRQEDQLDYELRLMQERVFELERRRDLIHSNLMNRKANAVNYAMEIAKEFYIQFANGYNPSQFPGQSVQAAAFLRKVMTKDVVCTEFKGVDMFLRQYEESSKFHDAMKLCLQSVDLIDQDEDIIQVKGNGYVIFRINRDTLKRFFPSVIQDEQLTQQLIGKEYIIMYEKVFHFTDGHIFQHESRIDMSTGLMNMVKDPFVAVKLLQASLMTKHGHWKIDENVVEDGHALQNSVLE
jgi:hypothetical protein